MAARDLWPTPTVHGNHNRRGLSATSGDGLSTAVKQWPTPLAHDAYDRGTGEMKRESPGLAAIVKSQETVVGALSPEWVELLMGWPLGWTSLEPLEGGRFAAWLSSPEKVRARWRDGLWEAGIPRVSRGTPHRPKRLTALGNGQVPQAAALAWILLTGEEGR